MRVLLSQNSHHPNSAGMIQALQDAGHEVLIMVAYPGGSKSATEVTGAEPVVLPFSPMSARLWGEDRKRLDVLGWPDIRSLARVLRDFAPEVVLVKDIRTTTFLIVMLARLRGAQCALLWNKPRFARKWPFLSLLAAPLLPRAKIHMGFFGSVGEPIPLGGLLGRSTMLPYPVPSFRSATAREQRSHHQGGPVKIVAIGSLSNRVKRMAWVSLAAHRLGLGRNVELTYIGLGDESSPAYREIRAVEQEHDLAPARFLFNVPHSELLGMLADFDVLAHPSARENFGAVITEAMAAGLAVLCGDRCGAKVCIEDGRSGLIFASDSPEDFEEKLGRLVEDAQLRVSMGAAAAERASTVLTPEAWLAGLLSVLDADDRDHRSLSA